MSSLNQLVSEIAHSIRQADNIPARIAIERSIIHARNELIRKSYANHHYTDQVLKQRFKLSLINVPDGDLNDTDDLDLSTIKRTTNKVPKPTRLENNIPFHSIRTVGSYHNINIPFVDEGLIGFYNALPGMTNVPKYFYINDYVYIKDLDNSINNIIIESVFEYPHEIPIETSDKGVITTPIDNDNEFLIPEDMISAIKALVLQTFNADVQRDTNEVENVNLVK